MLEAGQIINGTWGKMFLDDQEIMEVKAVNCEVEAEFAQVNMLHTLDEHEKLIGLKGSGSFTVYKVNTGIAKDVIEQWKRGKNPYFKIVFQLADPESEGFETAVIGKAWLSKLTLTQFEPKKLLEREFPFRFTVTSFEYEDTI
ncbi:phage tail tube protein [Brevibacillus dissolubilis]|uniref:phage tail tube protein n=1 Tax=Brevibacillus dissolubilis TaxID=1844116 RepID=UPI0011175F19|nr:phage tail tube protein [Brevibacillus dissolubilis]